MYKVLKQQLSSLNTSLNTDTTDTSLNTDTTDTSLNTDTTDTSDTSLNTDTTDTTDTTTDTSTQSSEKCSISVRQFSQRIYPTKFSMFLLILVTVYLSDYAFARRMKWESRKKSITQHYADIFIMCMFGTVIYSFSNMSNTFSIYTILGMFIGSFGISWLGSLPGFNFDLEGLRYAAKTPLTVVFVIFTVLLASAILTINQYRKCNMMPAFFIFLSIPVLIVGLSFILAKYQNKKGEQTTFHLHHWQWSIPLIFMFRFPNDITSSLVSGIFLGIFVDGISRYGPDSIYSDN